MYKLRLINFPHADIKEFSTKEEAVEVGKKMGFEFTVEKDGLIICMWSVFSGLCNFY